MQPITSENNRRIAKNTMMLYIRMLFIMAVSLYTSRVVLQVLGIEDYGIYSVVGGIITLFSFINGGMTSATQRYITFELGKKDMLRLKTVFSTSIQIHAIISLIVFILSETIGLWFLYAKMIIPDQRIIAAFWVYQCSIIATIVNIMSIPYNAEIIAHEKMSAFAYISIVEVILKLLIVFMLYISPWDKLIVYSVLILVVQVLVRFIYSSYCYRHFKESKYCHKIDVSLLKEMASFAGWSFWGNLASVLNTQGLNILLNVFFGPIVNAARGIAVQVQGVVLQFVSNFQMALNPQITKNYANGDIQQMHSLIFRSARFSFYLLYVFALPILLETDYILSCWLKSIPENSSIFTRLLIIISLLYALANPCVIANQATGKVKKYQLIVGGLLLIVVPISYAILKYGAPAYSVFIVHFCIELIALIVRIVLLRPISLNIYGFYKNVFKPIFVVVFVSIIIPTCIHCIFSIGFCRLSLVVLFNLLSVLFAVYFCGSTSGEKKYFKSLICKVIKKNNYVR